MNIGWAIDPYDRESSLHLVAYLDILGTTRRIKDRTHADETLNILHNLYTLETSTAKVIFEQESHIAFRIFSDNIVIALPLSVLVSERRRGRGRTTTGWRSTDSTGRWGI